MNARTAKYLLGEGLQAVRRHPSLSVSAVVAMTASLLVLGGVVDHQLQRAPDRGRPRGAQEVVVYLRPDPEPTVRLRVEERLKDVPGVVGVRYISPEEAWDNFTAEMSGEGLLEEIGDNPLPPSFELKLAGDRRDLASIETIAGEVGAWEEVDEVAYGGAWVSRLDAFARQLAWLNLGVLLAVGLAVVAVVANTIRLTVLAKRDMIEVMKVVGASEWFIRMPFLYEGMFQTLAASLVALGSLYGITRGVSEQFGGISFLTFSQIGAFLGTALFLGAAGSYLALRQVFKSYPV